MVTAFAPVVRARGRRRRRGRRPADRARSKCPTSPAAGARFGARSRCVAPPPFRRYGHTHAFLQVGRDRPYSSRRLLCSLAQLEQSPEKAAENCNTVHCAECDFCAGETTDGSDVALGKHNEKKLKHKGEGANGNSVPAFHDMTHRSEPYSAAAAFDWNFEIDER